MNMNDELMNNQNSENEENTTPVTDNMPEDEALVVSNNEGAETAEETATAEEQPAHSEDAPQEEQPQQEPGFEQPTPPPFGNGAYYANGPINMQYKPRRTPTWVVVLICVIGALYLIISATLIVAFLKFSRPDANSNPQNVIESLIDEQEVEDHLTINESPKSEGAKTTDGALTVKQVSEKVRASVVGVTCQSTANFSSSSVGSGIIMSEDGYIITNNHVIEGMTTIQVVLDSGETYDARLIGSDSRSDLAVIKVNATGLKAAEFGDSDKLEQGDPAIAIGNPAGLQLQNTVTYGIISAINRDIIVEDRTMTLIQTDASINPGNSGGPLVNEFGQVIGINTVKVGISYYEGLGFAIPMNTAKPIIDELISRGYVKGRPSIGISGTTLSERDSMFYGLPAGLLIDYVHPYSDAFKKGIRRGDIITKMNGAALSSTAEIKKIRDNFTAGDKVTLTIYRNSQEVDIEVILMDEATLSTAQSEAS